MGVSKILYDGVGIDLTQDTVAANKMLNGVIAHDSNGDVVEGNIATKTAANVAVDGATVKVPSGYYSAEVSKSVGSGSQGTPTATKSISGTTATITPSCTDTTGYITGTTKQGTGITVTAAELDTLGAKNIDNNGDNIDVIGYSKVNVNIPFITVRTGTGSPDDNLGVNGDIYLDLG